VIRVACDGVAYHRGALVVQAAQCLHIHLEPLPGSSPDFIPVEALWCWQREDVTDNYCHQSADELRSRVREVEQCINEDPIALANRLWVKDELDYGQRRATDVRDVVGELRRRRS
jgi:transposase